jgi:hypothetical protein
MFDWLVLRFAGVYVVFTMRREWLRLVLRQLRYGLVQVRVAHPRLANEKYLWRKTFDHDPQFVTVTDKAAAKDWVAEQGFDVRMPQTLWVGTDAHMIPDSVWERPFYLKATHGCQMNIAVMSAPEDRPAIIAKANAFLNQDHGARHRQWAYGGVPRQLIAEEVIAEGRPLTEIKFYTFGNVVEQYVVRRNGPPLSAARWMLNDDGATYTRSDKRTATSPIIDLEPLPEIVPRAHELAARIGEHFDHVRVDVLIDGDDMYLGELTLYSIAGRVYERGDQVDDHMNRSWDLRKSWFLSTPQSGWRAFYARALRRRLDRQDAT